MSLPVELLRRITVYLPSDSALAFSLVCRRVYEACDDWTVWKDVVHYSSDYPYGVTQIATGNVEAWKRYVVADAKASRGCYKAEGTVKWLPHLTALNHPAILSADLDTLRGLSDPVFSAPLFPANTEHIRDQFSANPTSAFDTNVWQLAQAASFCMSTKILSDPVPVDPPQFLRSAQWFRLDSEDRQAAPHGDDAKIQIMRHALANNAVGFFCAALRYALTHNSTTHPQNTAGLLPPPSALSIPFRSFMEPPVPFSTDSLEAFSKCHLSSMTEPSFFTGDDWIGYMSFPPLDQTKPFIFAGFPTQYCTNFGPSQVSAGIEQKVRFELIQEYNSDKYLIRSNTFNSQPFVHTLEVTVERSTGRLIVSNWMRLQSQPWITEGVITPFGVVNALLPGGSWMWMWKRRWSEGSVLDVGRQ